MNVLSLFDGISCGQVALKKAGIKVDNYYASEIDKYAIGITKNNFPNTIHLGDVETIDYSKLPKIDLLIGGSPCQGFSNAGDRLNFKDPRSKLFFEFVKALKTLKPKYFLLENVKMKAEWRDIITKHIGVEPVFINSVDFIPHHRQRYYWTNIPFKKWTPKKDTLSNYLQKNPDKKTFLTDTAIKRLESAQRFRGWFDKNSSHIGCLTANYYKIPSDGSYIKYNNTKRRLSPVECERLQGLNDNYTNFGMFEKSKKTISNTQRYKCLGNCWTINVISHIFSGLTIKKTKFKHMKKDSKENMINKLTSLVPDITDESFHISFQSDDYGEHICIYVENTEDGNSSLKEDLKNYNEWLEMHYNFGSK